MRRIHVVLFRSRDDLAVGLPTADGGQTKVTAGLTRRIGGVGGSYNWTEIERHDKSDLKMVLRWLKPFTQYEILLQAFNQFGKGPMAKIEAFTTSNGEMNNSNFNVL